MWRSLTAGRRLNWRLQCTTSLSATRVRHGASARNSPGNAWRTPWRLFTSALQRRVDRGGGTELAIPSLLWVCGRAAPYRVTLWRELAKITDLQVVLLESSLQFERDRG